MGVKLLTAVLSARSYRVMKFPSPKMMYRQNPRVENPISINCNAQLLSLTAWGSHLVHAVQ